MGSRESAGGWGALEQRRRWVARSELTLARPDWLPLREVPLEPDPLEGVARALATARDDLGESVEVAIDLLPLTAGERRRRRRAAVAEDRARGAGSAATRYGPASGAGGAGPFSAVGAQMGLRTVQGARKAPVEGWLAREERLQESRGVRGKVLGWDAAFWLQVLIRAESTVKGRHTALAQAVVAGFEVFSGENYFRVRGHRLGPLFMGADRWWSRVGFERRWRSGLHRGPRRAPMVTVGEIAGLLKPPTASCNVAEVARTGGWVPPAPRGLPVYRGQPDLLPLGWVGSESGEQPVGVPLAESTFGYTCGRTGAGKTYSAVARASAVFNGGHGGLFLDPHRDGVDLLKEHLCRADVWDIDLSDDRASMQAGWNLFSMEGCTAADIEGRVSAVVTGFAAALRWGEGVAPRALMLTTMATQALCELALRLPPQLAPTVFQMLPLLADEDWRNTVLPYLSPHVRGFFTQRFPRFDPRAVTPVTNIIDRMRSSPMVAALFGSPRSTFDLRTAMDSGRVVLWSTGTEAWANLVACLVTQDLFRAAMSRRNVPADRRRPFWVWLDEAQRISGTGSGSAGEAVARSLEESRKMGLRLQVMSQQPTRLAKPTLDAIMTNRSMLASHEVGADSARLLAKEWGGTVQPATITRLEQHRFLAQVTLGGKTTSPFRVRGFDIATEQPWVGWREAATPDVFERSADQNLRRRPVTEILAELDTLDERILDHLQTLRRRQPPQPDTEPGPTTSGPRRNSGRSIPLTSPRPEDHSSGDGEEARS